MSKALLNTAQAAAELGVDSSRIRQLCDAGELPGSEKLGRDWVIPRATVESYLKSRPAVRRGWPAGKPRKTPAGKRQEAPSGG